MKHNLTCELNNPWEGVQAQISKPNITPEHTIHLLLTKLSTILAPSNKLLSGNALCMGR